MEGIRWEDPFPLLFLYSPRQICIKKWFGYVEWILKPFQTWIRWPTTIPCTCKLKVYHVHIWNILLGNVECLARTYKNYKLLGRKFDLTTSAIIICWVMLFEHVELTHSVIQMALLITVEFGFIRVCLHVMEELCLGSKGGFWSNDWSSSLFIFPSFLLK